MFGMRLMAVGPRLGATKQPAGSRAVVGPHLPRKAVRRRRNHTRHRSRLVAVAVTLLLAFSFVVTFESQPGEATVANPWANATITRGAVGTGHGTGAQTFINTDNGFFPGDDSPDDEVVSSGDTVVYHVNMQFAASLAREVIMTLEVPEYLTWRTTGDQWCRSGHFVKATRIGNACHWQVPAGAVEQIGPVPLIFEAKDTGGRAVADQVVKLGTGLSGAKYSISTATPVTVVSAPTADVYVTFNQSYAQSKLYPMRTMSWSASTQWGVFYLTPVQLSYPNFHPTKGASTGGEWWGTFDVSSFPAGTSWTVYANNEYFARTPVNGLIDLGKNRGEVQVSFQVTWPNSPTGASCPDATIDAHGQVADGCWAANATHDFPVRVNVDPASFSVAGGMANNAGSDTSAAGWQPGDGLGMSVNTFDANRGSRAGQPYPNNDWSAARVVRHWSPPTPVGDWPAIYKDILAPMDWSTSVWDTPNVSVAANSFLQSRRCYSPTCMGAAPGTETVTWLYTYTGDLLWNDDLGDGPNGTPFNFDYLVFADSWNNSEQRLDLTRELEVSSALATIGDGYRVQWSPNSLDPRNLTDPNNAVNKFGDLAADGWYDAWTAESGWLLTDDDAALARSIRVIASGTCAAPAEPEPGDGDEGEGSEPAPMPPCATFTPFTRYEVRIPMVIADVEALAGKNDGAAINNNAWLFAQLDAATAALVTAPGSPSASAVSSTTYTAAYTLLRLPRTPEVYLKLAVQLVGEDGWHPEVTVPTGDLAQFRISPSVAGVVKPSAPITGEIEVELDRCLLDVELPYDHYWNAVLTPAVPAENGHVCGEADATPAIITLTPRNPLMPSWSNRYYGQGALPSYVFTAKPSLLVPGAGMTVAATITLDGFELSATAAAMVRSGQTGLYAAQLAADYPVAEVNSELAWTWELFAIPAQTEGPGEKLEVDPDLPVNLKPLESLDPLENSEPPENRDLPDGTNPASDTVLVLPHDGDGDLWNPDFYNVRQCLGLDEWDELSDDNAKRSHFEGTLSLSTAHLVLDDTLDATLWFTTDPVTDAEMTGADWTEVPSPTPADFDFTDATALRVTVARSAGVTAAKVHVELTATGNALGDEYVMWPSRTVVPALEGEEIDFVPEPCPAGIEIVASTITGRVWWDWDGNGRPEGNEPGIDGVTVTLHAVADDGALSEAIATTITDEDGNYVFDELHSGQYVTQVHRSFDHGEGVVTAIPEQVTTSYGQDLPVVATYSWPNRFGTQVRDTSGVIALGIHETIKRIDFGFDKPNPLLALDKGEAISVCGPDGPAGRGTGPGAGLCQVTWEVRLENVGTTPLSDVVFHDVLGIDAIDVRVIDQNRIRTADMALEMMAQANQISEAVLSQVRLMDDLRDLGLDDGGPPALLPEEIPLLDEKLDPPVWDIEEICLDLADQNLTDAEERLRDENLIELIPPGDRKPNEDFIDPNRPPIEDWACMIGADCAAAQAQCDGGPAAITPFATEIDGDWVTRSYAVGSIPIGHARQFTVTATYLQPMSPDGLSAAVGKVVANQAWATSPLTPYAALQTDPLSEGRPWAPLLPRLEDVDSRGIPGNLTCNTNADFPGQWSDAVAKATCQAPDLSGLIDLGAGGFVHGSVAELFSDQELSSLDLEGALDGIEAYTLSVTAEDLSTKANLVLAFTDDWIEHVPAGGLLETLASSITGELLYPPLLPALVTKNNVLIVFSAGFDQYLALTPTQRSWLDNTQLLIFEPNTWEDGTPYPAPTPIRVPEGSSMACNADWANHRAMDLMEIVRIIKTQWDPDNPPVPFPVYQTPEDQCDQVPAILEPSELQPGSLSGQAWLNPLRDGAKPGDPVPLAGVQVTLLGGPRFNQVFGTAVTDANGNYQFTGLFPGNYQVQFGISHLVPASGQGSYVFAPNDVGGAATDSWPNPATGRTELVTVVEQQETTDIDLGVYAVGTGITLTKTSPLDVEDVLFENLVPSVFELSAGQSAPLTVTTGEVHTLVLELPPSGTDVTLEVLAHPDGPPLGTTSGRGRLAVTFEAPEGTDAITFTLSEPLIPEGIDLYVGAFDPARPMFSGNRAPLGFTSRWTESGTSELLAPTVVLGPVPVTVSITNNGDEPLREIDWADETLLGEEIDKWRCTPEIDEATILEVDEAIKCIGYLPIIRDWHANLATVAARGTLTGRLVESWDDFGARREREVPYFSFRLFKVDPEGRPLHGADLAVDGHGRLQPINNQGEFALGELPAGWHQLRELAAPEGFRPPELPIVLVIDDDGALTSDHPLIEIDGSDIFLTNQYLLDPPYAGANAPTAWALLLVALAAGVGIWYTRARMLARSARAH